MVNLQLSGMIRGSEETLATKYLSDGFWYNTRINQRGGNCDSNDDKISNTSPSVSTRVSLKELLQFNVQASADLPQFLICTRPTFLSEASTLPAGRIGMTTPYS